MALHPVRRVKLSTQIEEQLKQQILVGKWKPGERLPSENELAEIFEVSRVSIRQALQSLSAQGLIETRIGDGSFISQPNIGNYMHEVLPDIYLAEDSLRSVMEFRRLFEGPVAELAATRCTSAQFEQLEELYRQMQDHAADLSENSYYDFAFHMLIGEMSQNPMVVGIYRILTTILRNSWHEITTTKGAELGLHDHGLLVEAFRLRDAATCRRIMEEHIASIWRLLYN